MEQPTSPDPRKQEENADLDVQKTRDLLASLQAGGVDVAPAPVFDFESQPAEEQPVNNRQMTGKDYFEFFQQNRTARFTHDEQGRNAFRMMSEYMDTRKVDMLKAAEGAIGQMAEELGGLADAPIHPGKFIASTAEAAAKGIRDMYGIFAQSEDPGSPFFKLKSWMMRVAGIDDGDIDSQMRHFHEAREHNNKSYEYMEGKGTIVGEFLPEGYREMFNKLVDPKFANALSYAVLDIPEIVFSSGMSTPATAAKLAMQAAPKAAAKSGAFAAWSARSAERLSNYAAVVGGTALEKGGAAVKAPFKAIYGASQSAAQLGGDFAGNAVRNMATAEVIEAGAELVGTTVRHPAMGFLRSFGLEAFGELAQVAGADIVDRALGKVNVKMDALGQTTLERLASGTAKGADTMSREAQLLAKGLNASIGWAPSMSGQALKTMFRDGIIGAGLGYANSREEGAGAGLGMGIGWGGLSGTVRHVHAYTNYTHQDQRVVDNFNQYVVPSFARLHGVTAGEMARRFADHVQSFGDLRTSAIEMSHLSTLIAHETGLHGDGNVLFYFGNSAAEFDKVLIESGMKADHMAAMSKEFKNLGDNPAMFTDVELERGVVKKLVAINSDAYRPTSGRHEIAHMLFRSVAEANGDMDHIYVTNPTTGQRESYGKTLSPRYLTSIYGASKDLGVMPDAGWDALIQHYGALERFHYESALKSPNAAANAQQFGASLKGLVTEFRHLSNTGTLDLRGNMDHIAMAKILTKVAEEAFAYYHAATSNVFAVDKYVKDPAHRNMLRAWAENRAAAKNSRIIADLELAGIEIRGKLTNKDGSIKLFDDQGNPAIETSAYDDGKVIRLPAMDTWIEGVIKSAYTRGEVSVSTLDPMRQAALAKTSGKEHLFNAVAGGGMRLKGKQELDELATKQTQKILGAISQLPDDIRPLVQEGADGTKRLLLEQVNNEGLEAIRKSGAFTDREFNELAGMIHIARQGAQGNPVFNVMNCTLLGATHQIRRGAAVFRLRGEDVPVTYRTFVPLSVEVYFKDKDKDGNPLRTPSGAVVVHSLDVAAENRRLTKMFKRGDVQQLWNGNFDDFVKSYQDYVINQSGLNGPRVPTAELFRPRFGADAERVRDILYETFGGRKPKDAPFINTPGNGYLGGADDPNRPFYTMRFDTMSDTRMHPTSWNARSRLPLFPYVPSAYEGITRNMMYAGFEKLPLANGMSFLRNRNGFEIYQGEKGFNLFDMYGIKIGTYKSVKSAIEKAEKDVANYDETDLQPAQESHVVEANGQEETLLFPSTPAYMLKGLHERSQRILQSTNSVPGRHLSHDVLSAITAAEIKIDANGNMTDKNGNPVNEKLLAAAGITAKINSIAPGSGFPDTVRIGVGKEALTTSVDAAAGANEAVRISPLWVRSLQSLPDGVSIADRQLAIRMATSERIAEAFKDGKITMPSGNGRAIAFNFLQLTEAMEEGSPDFKAVEADFDAVIRGQKSEINTEIADKIDELFGLTNPGSSSKLLFAASNWDNKSYIPERMKFATFGVTITPALASAMASNPDVIRAGGSGVAEMIKMHSQNSGEQAKPIVINVESAAAFKAMVAAGGLPNEWLMHHEVQTPGFIGEMQGLLAKVEKSGGSKLRLSLENPIARAHLKDYVSAARVTADKGGPYRKSVSASFDGKNGRIRTNESGKREGALFTVLANIADKDIESFLSQESIYRAIEVASDPANYVGMQDPIGSRARDMASLQLLIHNLQHAENRYHHELKTTADREVGIRGVRELTGGRVPASGSYSAYTTAPSLSLIPKPGTSPAGFKPKQLAILNNVNHNTPGRFRKVMDTKGSMLRNGVLTVFSGDPGSHAHMGTRYSDISYIVSTSDESLLLANQRGGKPSMTPGRMMDIVDGAQTPGEMFYNPGDRSISPAALGIALKSKNAAGLPNMIRSANDVAYSYLRRFISKEDLSGLAEKYVGVLSQEFMLSRGESSLGDPVKLAPIMANLTADLVQLMPEEKVQFAEDMIVGLALNMAALKSSGVDMPGYTKPGQAPSGPGKGYPPRVGAHLHRADAIAGMSRILQAVQHSELTDADSRFITNVREKWAEHTRRGAEFIRTGYVTLSTKEIPLGRSFGQTNYMLTGRKAIERLDSDRKDLMRSLGLLGKAKDVFGNEFDYLEISDKRSKLLMDRYDGRTAMIAAKGMADAENVIKNAVAEIANGEFEGPYSDMLMEHANRAGLKLKDIFSHDELFALYPGLGDSKVTFENGGFSAGYYGSSSYGSIALDISLLLRDELALYDSTSGIKSEYAGQFIDYKGKGGLTYEENLRRVIIHEVQHMIYHAEGWSEIWDWSLTDADTGKFDRKSMIYAGPAALTRIEQMLGGTEITPVVDSFGPDIDQMFVTKLAHMQHETSRVLSFDKANKTIRPSDTDTATAAIERIIHAPLSQKMMREVIPETIRWTQSLDSTFHMLANALESKKASLEPETFNSMMSKLNDSNQAVATIIAQVQRLENDIKAGVADPKVAALSLLRAIDNNRKFMMIEDPSWSVLFDAVAPNAQHNFRTMSYRGKARVWASLLEAHDDLGARGGKMPPNWAQWHIVKIANAMGGMMYFASPDEITARVTEGRANMSTKQLAESRRLMPTSDKEIAMSYQVGRYIGQVANNPGLAIPFDDSLFMLGGAKGSETFDADMFGGGTPNTFRLGMRMMARAALLSHYVSVRDVGAAAKLVTYSSRGWRIGQDGKPEFVFSIGRLKGAEQWGREMTGKVKLSDMVNQAIDFLRGEDESMQGMMEFTSLGDEPLADQAKKLEISESTLTAQNSLFELIRSNRFINPAASTMNSGNETAFGLLAGLSKDGVSVKIEDLAKALGATIAVDSMVTMQSPVLNAIHAGSVPLVMTGGSIVDTFRLAGVDENGIELAKLRQIDKNFAGVSLSAGELAEIVAVMHDVPFESIMAAPMGAKSILVESAKADPELLSKVKARYRDADPSGTIRTRMSLFINEVISRGGNTSAKPLKSVLTASTMSMPGSGIMFLQDMLDTQIRLSWSGNEYLRKLLGEERFRRFAQRYHDPAAQEIVLKHMKNLASDQSSFQQRQTSEAVLTKFAERLERVLFEITPLAEKVASHIVKLAEKENQYGIDMLADMYKEAINAATKDMTSASVMDYSTDFGGPLFELRSRMEIRATENPRDVAAIGTASERATKNTIGMYDPRTNNSIMLPAFGLIGGATDAFMRTSSARARYLGTAGFSTAPSFGLDTIPDTRGNGKQRGRELASGANIKAGPSYDNGIRINLFGQDVVIDGAMGMTGRYATDTVFEGLYQDIVSSTDTTRPGSANNMVASMGMDPSVAATITASNRLLAMGKNLLQVIESYNNEYSIDLFSEAVHGSMDTGASGQTIRRAILDDPAASQALALGDLSNDLLKAKAFMSTAYEISDRPEMNVGLANFGTTFGPITRWGGYGGMSSSMLAENYGGFRPLSQTSVIRSYITPDGRVVLASAFEALADSRDPVEVKIVDAITGNGQVERHAVAHKPTMVMMEGWVRSMNLFAEDERQHGIMHHGQQHESDTSLKGMGSRVGSTADLALSAITAHLGGEYTGNMGFIREVISGYKHNWFPRNLTETMTGETIMDISMGRMRANQDYNLHSAVDRFLKDNNYFGGAARVMGGDGDKGAFAYQYAKYIWGASVALNLRTLFDGITEPTRSILLEKIKRGDDTADIAETLASTHHAGFKSGSAKNGMQISALDISQTFALAGNMFIKDKILPAMEASGVFSADEMARIRKYVDQSTAFDPVIAADMRATGRIPDDGIYHTPGAGMDLTRGAHGKHTSYGMLSNYKAGLLTGVDIGDNGQGTLAIIEIMKGLAKMEGRRVRFSLDTAEGVKFKFPHNEGIEVGGVTDAFLGGYAPGEYYHHGNDTVVSKDLVTGGLAYPSARPHHFGKGSAMEIDDSARYYLRNAGASTIPYDVVSVEDGGALTALLDVPKYSDFAYDAPKPDGIAISAARTGRSALSSSVTRSAMVESIVAELKKANQTSLDVAPAGHHLSYVGADPMMLASAVKDTPAKDYTLTWNNKGLRSINRTIQGAYKPSTSPNYESPKVFGPEVVTVGAPEGTAKGLVSDARIGMGKNTGPDQMAEFAPKKGYAWQRLPDGRIMINVTGDHMAYKLDYKALTKRQPGYGFSLIEGLGWDQQNGVLIPMRINSHVGIADMLAAMEHPMAGMFSHEDPAIIGQHIKAAQTLDRRNFHRTRGEYKPEVANKYIGGRTVTSHMTHEELLAYLQDPDVDPRPKAEVSAQYNGHQSANGVISIVLPANASAEQIRETLVALHMEPVLGLTMYHQASHARRYSYAGYTGQLAYQPTNRTLPTKGGGAPGKSGFRIRYDGQMPGRLPHETLKGLMETALMLNPTLIDDIDSLIGKMAGGENGYFLPDTERVLSMNGDTGLAIASMFPGRPDLLKYSWDAKNMHGIKIWKRTIPKGAEGYHAHVVQFDAPMEFTAEGGLRIGPKAIAFKTPEQATAFANRIAASRGGAEIARALAAGEVEVVAGPDTPNSPFMPDPSAVKGQFIDGYGLSPMQNGAHFVGDIDTPMDQKSARALSRALGANKHLRFTPGDRLMMIGGKSMTELEDIVRSKINFGAPKGTMEFASKAMNAIVNGVLPNSQKLESMNGEDWFKVMKKAGVSGEEMRQTGLAALFLNAKNNKLTRMDVAEFLAATIPMLRRHDLFTSPELRLGAIAALGGGVAGGDNLHRINGGYLMPYMPDSVLQTRMNQHQAISGILGSLERLELTHKALLEAQNRNSDATGAAIVAVNKVLLTYASRIGMDINELQNLGAAELAKKIQDKIQNLAAEAYTGKDTFANLNYSGLETARLTMNEHISSIRSLQEVSAMVGGVMPELVLPLRQMVDEFLMGTRSMELPLQIHKGNSPYSWASNTKEIGLENLTGQSLDNSYNKFWGTYTSGYQHVQTHAAVRFADRYATAEIEGYIQSLRAIKRSLIDKTSPEDVAKLEANQVLLSTAERVLSVRNALKKLMQAHSSQGHFGGTLPNNSNIGGSGGVHEIGHSRFSQSLAVSGLSIEGFADPLGFSGAMHLGNRDYALVPLAYPITLLEEVQSDFAQKIEGVGIDENMDVYLPLGPEEEASLAAIPEYKALIEKAAEMRAMANSVMDFVSSRLVTTMMNPSLGDGSVGSVVPLNVFLRLQLDQTDILNRGILAVQTPGLLRGTGRTVKPPESLKQSLAGKFHLTLPDDVPSMEFDHELIALMAEYQGPNGFRNMPDEIRDQIRDRMIANIESTRAWNDSFGRKIGGAGTDGAINALRADPRRGFDAIRSNLQNIMARGQEQMAEKHAVVKQVAAEMAAVGDKSDIALFMGALAGVAESSRGDLGRSIGCELAGMAILDEEIAMNIGAYARGEYQFNYEAIARRALERIRARYTDTRTFTGKTILLAYEELLRTPAEERPFLTLKDNLADPPQSAVAGTLLQDLGSVLRMSNYSEDKAAARLLHTPIDQMDPSILESIEMIGNHLAQGGCLYVANTNTHGVMSEGSKRTFRVFRSMEEGGHEKEAMKLFTYVLERAAKGQAVDKIQVVDADYHRHVGSAAGDFVKQTIEVLAAMSKRADFAVEAAALEAKAAEAKKGLPLVASWKDDRVVPASLPYAGENAYKSMQLQMSIVDSINRGQRGVGIMDASWQLSRGHGLSESATIGLGVGKNRRVILYNDPEIAGTIQTIIACYERVTGKNPSQPDGPHGGFLHALGEMEDDAAINAINGNRFDHQGSSADLISHLHFSLGEMMGAITDKLPSGSVRALQGGLNKLISLQGQFKNAIKKRGSEGPAFVGGKKNISHGIWASGAEKFVANGLKDATLVTMPTHTGMGGWGYITNYGLPQHKADIMLAGASKKFRMEYSLDAFERPVLQVEGGNMNMLDPKTGKLILSVDVRDEAAMKLFRERFLQASKYVGGNWMVRSFLKEWAPVGGYVDLTVPGSHATNKGPISDFNFGNAFVPLGATVEEIMAAVNRKYATGQATVLENAHQLMTPEYDASVAAIEAAGGVANGGPISPAFEFTLEGQRQKMHQPASHTFNPLMPDINMGRTTYGTPGDGDLVRALVATFTDFGQNPDADKVAAFTMRMRNPVVTTLVHSPEARTKEMDMAFRRKMAEGVYLLMAAGERPRAGKLSQTGFQTLVSTIKNREELPITYAKNVLVDRTTLPPLEAASKPAPKDNVDKRKRVFDREKAVELMMQGYPDTQIASHLGVSRVAILNLRKNAGVAPLEEGSAKGVVRNVTPESVIEEYAKERAEGASWREIHARRGKQRKGMGERTRIRVEAKLKSSKPDGSNPMPTDSLSDPQHPNQIRPNKGSSSTDMAKLENMEREMNE